MYCRYAKTSIWDNHKQCPLNVEVNSIVSFIGSVLCQLLFHYSTILSTVIVSGAKYLSSQ